MIRAIRAANNRGDKGLTAKRQRTAAFALSSSAAGIWSLGFEAWSFFGIWSLGFGSFGHASLRRLLRNEIIFIACPFPNNPADAEIRAAWEEKADRCAA